MSINVGSPDFTISRATCIINYVEKSSIEHVINLLSTKYSTPRRRRKLDPVSELVQTILSQNTSDTNSWRAFESLQAAFDNWEAVSVASVGEISATIKSGGMNEIKARYIKQVLDEIKKQRGELDLNFLREPALEDAREWLKRLPGVGTKTANCVLLFSLGKPALPVDTHVLRVAKRLGLVALSASADKATMLLEGMIKPERVYQFHVLLIEHGRRTCKAQRPRCIECTLAEICPSYKAFIGKEYGSG